MREEVQQRRPRSRFNLSTFTAFRYRDFRLLWLAQVGTGFAQQGEMLTRSWLVLELTGSGTMLALAHVTRAVGSLAVAPIAGVLADRFDRRTLLIVSNLVKGSSFVGIGLLILFGWIATWHVIASAVIAGAGMSLQQTSSDAVVPSLVPREGIMNAVALHSTTNGINRVAGPGVSGLLIAVVGTEGAYFAAAFALTFPVVLYALMQPLKIVQEGPKESFLASFKAGVRFVTHSPAIRMVILVSVTVSGLAMPFLQLMPMYVTQVLHMGPATLGAILALPGVLSIAGGLFAASLGDFRYKGVLLFIAVVSPSIAAILMSQTSMVWTSMVAMGIFSALSSQFMPSTRSITMKATPNEYRGRVASIQSLQMGLGSGGVVAYGVVADMSGVQASFLLFGALALALNVTYFVASPTYRRLN